MSESENYLDELLEAVGKKKTREDTLAETLEEKLEDELDEISEEDLDLMDDMDAEKEESPDDAFLDAFDAELGEEDDTDEFLRQFEQELSGEELSLDGDAAPAEGGSSAEESLAADGARPMIADIDRIMESVGITDSMEPAASMEPADPVAEDGLEDVLLSTEDFPEEPEPEEKPEPDTSRETEPVVDFGAEDMESPGIRLEGMPEEKEQHAGEEDVLPEQDKEIGGLTDFSDLFADETQEVPSGEPSDGIAADGAVQKKEPSAKGGFLEKLTEILFGGDEDEDEEEDAQAIAEQKAAKKAAKEQKAKEKKEKKEKQPKPEKPPKPKKEKKPKPPKEPDRTPPLPKVPVALVLVLAVSLVILILSGTNLSGYSKSFADAEEAYIQGDYTGAFQAVAGLSVKEADADAYQKYSIAAMVGGEYEAYENMFDAGIYDMALDSLVRTVERYDKYIADAGTCGCANELEKIAADAEAALSADFGISMEQARDIYAMTDKEDYSTEIYRILGDAGYTEVTE